MVTEYELTCTSCGGALTRASVDPGAIEAPWAGKAVDEPLAVARCSNCGVRHFPRTTLEKLDPNRGS